MNSAAARAIISSSSVRNDADSHPAILGRDQRAIGCVAVLVQGDAEELEPLADAASYFGRVLADPASEDQGIQAAEGPAIAPTPVLAR